MEPIPETLKAFIGTIFETVDELRILLLLQANPDQIWNALSVSARLNIRPDAVQNGLRRFCQQGVLASLDGEGSRYAYQPANAEVEQMLRAVAELDRTRPVTLVRLIYARPT